MKRFLCLLLCACFLAGCAEKPEDTSRDSLSNQASVQDPESAREIPFVSRFTEETRITLSDDGVTFTGCTGGEQMQYTGTDVGMDGHGFGGMGQKPFQDGEVPSMPEGEMPPMPEGEIPPMPEGEMPTRPQDGRTPPEGGGFPGFGGSQEQACNTKFYMNDKVNAFSGVCPAA